jgi:hypothetical protein
MIEIKNMKREIISVVDPKFFVQDPTFQKVSDTDPTFKKLRVRFRVRPIYLDTRTLTPELGFYGLLMAF